MSDLSIFNKVEKRQSPNDEFKDTVLLIDAVKSLFPECNHGYSVLEDTGVESWGGKGDKPSLESLKAEQTRLQTLYDSLQYQRSRATAFPSIADQMDMQYHDQLDGTTTWKDAIAKVKSDNPKE
jgi:hypothetical protein